MNWLDPVRPEVIEANFNGQTNIASTLKPVLDPEFQGFEIAIVGVDSKWANRVRRQLYSFSSSFTNCSICDLGNLHTISNDSIGDTVNEIVTRGAIPVLIGVRPDHARQLWRSIQSGSNSHQGMFIRESFPVWMHTVEEGERLCFLGLQSHLLDRESKKYVDIANVTWQRLSKMRDKLDETEPAIRDTHYLNFDLSAIRFADLPSQISHSTSGLFSEEACRIARYAGLAPDLQYLTVSGHDPLSPDHIPSANTTAQLIWYFISGVDNRIVESPTASERFTQYVVHLQRFDFDLKFYKSNMTGRWWLELPAEESNQLFSCAYGDYLAACEDVVTDRIIGCVEMSMNVTHR